MGQAIHNNLGNDVFPLGMDTSMAGEDDSGPLTEVISSVECAAYKKIAASYFWYSICVQVLMA